MEDWPEMVWEVVWFCYFSSGGVPVLGGTGTGTGTGKGLLRGALVGFIVWAFVGALVGGVPGSSNSQQRFSYDRLLPLRTILPWCHILISL